MHSYGETFQIRIRNRNFDKITNLALTQSNMVSAGFPVQTGFRPNAYRSGALIDPAPGNKPAEVG